MTRAARKSIDNAIWLCAIHAALIDTDVAKFTAEVLKQWRQNHEARTHAAIGIGTTIIPPAEAAYSNWVARVHRILSRYEVDHVTQGRHHPVGRLIAPSERLWAGRAVAEGQFSWMPGSTGVSIPGTSFVFQPTNPTDPIEFTILNPGAFDDLPPFKSFRLLPRFDFGGVQGHVAFEWGPPHGIAYFFRLGWPIDGPQPIYFGVGGANASVLGFLRDKVEGHATVSGREYRYFGSSNPLTATTSAYLVMPSNNMPMTLIAGLAPAPMGPPPEWKLMTLRFG